MWTDPIVDELHKIREEHAKKFHNNLHAIFADFKEKEVQSGRLVISLPVKRKLPQATSSESTIQQGAPGVLEAVRGAHPTWLSDDSDSMKGECDDGITSLDKR